MSRVRYLQCRRWSSSSKPARKYLENWVGAKAASTHDDESQNSKITLRDEQLSSKCDVVIPSPSVSNLLLSGTSYLLPTLRIERKDTPESLSQRLNGTAATVDRRPQQPTLSWRCPIVLDLTALSPDGSPHYQPPPVGHLTEIVQVLNRHGVQVLGLTTAGRHLPPTLEKEAESMPLLGSGRRMAQSIIRNSNNNSNSNNNKLDLADVLRFFSQQRTTVETYIDENLSSTDSPRRAPQEAGDIHCIATEQSQTDLESNEVNQNNHDPQMAEEDVLCHNDNNLSANDTLTTTTAIEVVPPSPTVYHGSVRSGQQVSSEKGRSLLILGSVSSGGEVMADGDIYIFGKLRGRALAGLGSDNNNNSSHGHHQSPRIVASAFDAELVCIGEAFTTIDCMEDVGLTQNQSAMVLFENGKLIFRAI